MYVHVSYSMCGYGMDMCNFTYYVLTVQHAVSQCHIRIQICNEIWNQHVPLAKPDNCIEVRLHMMNNQSYYVQTYCANIHSLLFEDVRQRQKQFVSRSSQYMSLFWKLLTVVVFTKSTAPFDTRVTPIVCNVPFELLNLAVPLLAVQVILPIPFGPDICCRSVMGN